MIKIKLSTGNAPKIKAKQNKFFISKDSKKGRGLFASVVIPANTILFKITGTYINFKETLELKANENYCLQTDINTYIVPHYPFILANHSCEPNCGINKDLEFVSISDIQKGKELVWDYSTSMLERHWILECKCKAKTCREFITDFDLLPLAVQQRYSEAGIVMPFISRFFELYSKIRNERKPLPAEAFESIAKLKKAN